LSRCCSNSSAWRACSISSFSSASFSARLAAIVAMAAAVGWSRVMLRDCAWSSSAIIFVAIFAWCATPGSTSLGSSTFGSRGWW
jgi:hypothetical protein